MPKITKKIINKIKKNKKVVMIFGTFDGLHLGHQNFLKQALKQGNYLVAVVARDKTVFKLKNKWPVDNEQVRLNKIKSSNLVNEVVLGKKINFSQNQNNNKNKECFYDDKILKEFNKNSIDSNKNKKEEDKYEVIEIYKPDVICLGYDQQFFVDKLKNKLEEFGLKETKIVRLKAYKPEVYKSSLLRKESLRRSRMV